MIGISTVLPKKNEMWTRRKLNKRLSSLKYGEVTERDQANTSFKDFVPMKRKF